MGFFRKMFTNNRKSLTSKGSGEARLKGQNVSPSVEENLTYIQNAFFHTEDLKTRTISYQGKKGLLVYLNSTTDFSKIMNGILTPLSRSTGEKPFEEVITSPHVEKNTHLNSVIEEIVHGRVAVLFEGLNVCYIVQAHAIYKRDVSEPDNEKVIRGSHEGFVENLIVNIHLIRKRMENRQLTVKYHTLGKETRTKTALMYMHNLVNPQVVKEIERRLKDIRADQMLSPGFIQEYIEERTFSIFPQMLNTERPDRVMGQLMEGRVALLMEGSPTVLIAPITFSAFYQSPDEYNARPVVGSFIRLIRFLSFFTAVFLPAFYIAVVSFHPEVVPSELVWAMRSSVKEIPFRPILEALLLELTVELIREGGIRLPSPVGQTIGIVGGLVIGQSAVEAKLVSNTMIIVVALTAIASFVVPSNEMGASVRILRFPLMFMAAFLGFPGITFGVIFLLIHLARLESFGTPYFAPAMPFRLRDMKDTLIRFAVWQLDERPVETKPQRLKQESDSRGWLRDDRKRNGDE